MTLLNVINLHIREADRLLLSNIQFSQEAHEKIGIIGETGCGKTTLLKTIAGFIQPDTGEVRFLNKKVNGPQDQLVPGHPEIAFLSQHFELRNNYWVYEILSYANVLPQNEADHLYQICHIDHLLNRRTHELSGGEKQRIALARLLVTAPKLLLLDEPYSNLDQIHRSLMQSIINRLSKELSITLMLVSHDVSDLLAWADTLFVMKDGTLLQEGIPESIYRQPINAYAAGLLGTYHLIDTSDPELAEINGLPKDIPSLLVRPGDFIVTNKEPVDTCEAIIQQIYFHGSYYIADVFVGKQFFSIQTNDRNLQQGNKIHLNWNGQNVWSL